MTDDVCNNPCRARRTVRSGGIIVDLIAEGRGRPVVLLPSRGRDSEDFDAVAEGIAAQGFRVLRPQPRGAGASTGPVDGISMRDLADDVAMIIEREESGPAILAGHAFGNWVARMVATARPELVSGIVLIAAAAKTFPDELRAVVRRSGDLSLSDDDRLSALRQGFFFNAADAVCWLDGWAPNAMAAQAVAIAATPQSEYWQAGGVPLLDLVPEADPFKPREKWYETIEEFGARASVRIIANASHALIPEQPQAVVDAIVGWARALEQGV